MKFELADLQDQVGITFVTVTHDQDEALSMASRIAVINKGDVAQMATPSELYEYHANRFVADFVGSVDIFEGQLILTDQDRPSDDGQALGKVFLMTGFPWPPGTVG